MLRTWRSSARLAAWTVLSVLSWAVLTPRAASAAGDDAELGAAVRSAIAQAQQFLIGEQLPDGSWSRTRVGESALVLLALTSSGLDESNAAVASGLRYLSRVDPPGITYDLALSIMALSSVKAGDRYKGRIYQLAQVLEEGQGRGANSGGWHYEQKASSYDNSCTQFALLGLREASYMAGYPVDRDTWNRSRAHWLRTQVGSRESVAGAGWPYNEGNPVTGSMTVGGISSLVIIQSHLRDDPQGGELDCCGGIEDDEMQKAIDAGVRWLGEHFLVRGNPGPNPSMWQLYYLYGLERAGRLSGRRFFGDHDWYREGARYLVETQRAVRGTWQGNAPFENSELIATSYALLFLSKGLAPVLINKLKFGPRDPASGEPLTDDWNRNPNDARNLVDYLSGRDKWPSLLTWQVLDLDRAVQEDGVQALLQAPVQLLTGMEAPDSIDGPSLELLREYVAQGGFVFAVQNCEQSQFDLGFRRLIERMFPNGEYRLQKLPSSHDVYRQEFLITENPPELWGVDLGCRTAIMYAPFDHSCRWEHWLKVDPPDRSPQIKATIGRSMQLGANVIAYATNREVHDKLQGPEALTLADEDASGRGTIRMARLRHAGGWDTARNAARHLLDALEKKYGLRPATQIANLPATDPALVDYPLLYIHGRQTFSFSPAERDRLRQHLENGGLLFGDACCGAEAFDRSFRLLIEQTFGRKLERIPIEHELFHSPWGFDIRRVERRLPRSDRPSALLETELSVGEPILEGLEIDGRLAVIYSKYDLSCALERQSTSACSGYTTEDASRIAMNIVLYSYLQQLEPSALSRE
jgi:hypothetical protein